MGDRCAINLAWPLRSLGVREPTPIAIDGTLLDNHALEDECVARALRESLALRTVIATSEDGPARPDIVQAAICRAAERIGISRFDRVVSIGDGVWDVTAARALNLPFVEELHCASSNALIGSAGCAQALGGYHDLQHAWPRRATSWRRSARNSSRARNATMAEATGRGVR